MLILIVRVIIFSCSFSVRMCITKKGSAQFEEKKKKLTGFALFKFSVLLLWSSVLVKPTVKMSDSSKSLITVPCDVDKIDCERCPTVNNSVFTFFCNVGENWLWKMPDLLITVFSLCPAMVVRTDYERCLTVIIVSCNIGETEGCLWKLHNSLSPGLVMLMRFDCERSDWYHCEMWHW